jgi:hypothetical protein
MILHHYYENLWAAKCSGQMKAFSLTLGQAKIQGFDLETEG